MRRYSSTPGYDSSFSGQSNWALNPHYPYLLPSLQQVLLLHLCSWSGRLLRRFCPGLVSRDYSFGNLVWCRFFWNHRLSWLLLFFAVAWGITCTARSHRRDRTGDSRVAYRRIVREADRQILPWIRDDRTWTRQYCHTGWSISNRYQKSLYD